MHKVKVNRLDTKNPSQNAENKTYDGYMWGFPTPGEFFVMYKKTPTDCFTRPGDQMVSMLRTSFVREVAYTGPVSCYFKTENSLYKLEVEDEDFAFNKPYTNDFLG